MPRDIDIVIEKVRALHPDATIEQLKVTHPADDDGLWFFGFPGLKDSIQVESSAGSAPFTIEHSGMKVSSDAISDAGVEQTSREVAKYLGLLRARAKEAVKPPTEPHSHMGDLPGGWFPVSESEASLFAAELRKEMSPAHPLNGIAAVCLARRKDRDDYLFQVPLIDKTHVIVHLTWSKETSADFPWTTFFKNEDDFNQNWKRIFE